jgi:hypothetical protein
MSINATVCAKIDGLAKALISFGGKFDDFSIKEFTEDQFDGNASDELGLVLSGVRKMLASNGNIEKAAEGVGRFAVVKDAPAFSTAVFLEANAEKFKSAALQKQIASKEKRFKKALAEIEAMKASLSGDTQETDSESAE